MTIGIDIRVLAKGTRTGVEEYVLGLLPQLFLLAPNIQFKLFSCSFKKGKAESCFLGYRNVKHYHFRLPNRIFFTGSRFLNFPKIDRILGGVDVYFNPHLYVAPLSRKCSRIMVFHDLAFEHYPEFFPKKKWFWHKVLMAPKKQARNSRLIIADSDSTKQDLISIYRIPETKIRVIYPGLNPADNRQWVGDNFKKKYNLPNEFILYFGTIEPRKNLVSLIKAFSLFKEKMNKPDLKLVLAGTRGWLYKDILREARESKYCRDIFFTGFVDEADKPFLYRLAQLFVYPSFFEGFGFPPLEAMACGVPTIVSYASSLPEVVADAAIMIDPYNIDEMVWAMKEILTDEELQKNLSQKGLKRAQEFSWKKCAKNVLDVLLQ